jgi:2,5-diketo-D-gluconate reductase A
MTEHTSTTTVPEIELSDGHRIPQLGFGVFQVPPEDTADVVLRALETGYRHIDTAAAYQNESGVGEAIARSGLPREELFVTTKLWNTQHGRERVSGALERCLERLGLDYVDLYLIHWPVPSQELYVETWEGMIEARRSGHARSIGVSNFLPEHLDRIIESTGETPVINQVELHPYFQQSELRGHNSEHGVATEAWSPLGQGRLLDDSTLEGIAAEHGRTAAQVVLRWHIQLGNVVIPKSVTPSRIEENFSVFDFELDADQMQAIAGLDRGERTGPDPASFG